MVPALIGSGSPSSVQASGASAIGPSVDLRDLLNLAQIILLMGRQPANDAVVRKELGDVPARHPDPIELNERQRWFLDRVAEGHSDAKELAAVWEVSLRTARRDIGALQKARLLEYFGSRRKGRYRRIP